MRQRDRPPASERPARYRWLVRPWVKSHFGLLDVAIAGSALVFALSLADELEVNAFILGVLVISIGNLLLAAITAR